MPKRARDTCSYDEPPRYSCISMPKSVVARDKKPYERTSHWVLSVSSSLRLTLSNSSAKSSIQMPVYFEDDAIEGIVHVVGERGDSIQSLSITILGKILVGTTEACTFFETGRTLWRRKLEDGKPVEKLRGSYNFQFSLRLPRKVSKAGYDTTRLPQTFRDPNSRISVSYQLVVRLERGRLRSDLVVRTPFAYVPLSTPPPFSLLRQLAYRSRSVAVLPDPASDPEGWYSLPPIPFSAAFSSPLRRLVGVPLICELSLAAPLSYTRGSVLPLHISFSADTSNEQDDTAAALALLSFPSILSESIVLRRRIRFTGKRGSFKDEYTEMGSPFLWRTDHNRHRMRRALQGEITLTGDLIPSTRLGVLSVSYELVLKPLTPPGLTCAHAIRGERGADVLWAVQPVEIASIFCPGPRPIAYAPYIQPSSASSAVYERRRLILRNTGGIQKRY